MANLLLQEVDYKTEKTRFGIWRRFLYESGAHFAEFRSHATMFGWPLLHYTSGVCPETGRRRTAKGIVAVGRLAVGGLAIGQASLGAVAIGQLGVGLLFGLGQAATGVWAVGQLALGGLFAAGQVTAAAVAIGQMAAGEYVLAQIGYGKHVWSQGSADPAAVQYFQDLWEQVKGWLK